MNKEFEKILERLEENKSIISVNMLLDDIIKDKPKELGQLIAYDNSIKIVQEVAEEYNGGWISCSDRLPSGLDFVLYTHKDGEVDICSIEYFYDYLDKFTALQPLPKPFKERD